MLQFSPISLDDREWVINRLREDDRQACDYSFANNYLWRDVNRVELAKEQGCFMIRYQGRDGRCYTPPIGAGNKKGMLDLLLETERGAGTPVTLGVLLKEDLAWLEQNYTGQYTVTTNRDDYDYVYDTEKLTTLAGKKLHGKRNHIARFKDGGNWRYRDMMPESACVF